INMAFNLGRTRLARFGKMWAAIHIGDYALAAEEMLDSRWARQVGERAHRLAEMMRDGGASTRERPGGARRTGGVFTGGA
ncbi:MAG: hypothetical protein ACE5EY_11830, partial [Anaerolineae bacterium]